MQCIDEVTLHRTGISHECCDVYIIDRWTVIKLNYMIFLSQKMIFFIAFAYNMRAKFHVYAICYVADKLTWNYIVLRIDVESRFNSVITHYCIY